MSIRTQIKCDGDGCEAIASLSTLGPVAISKARSALQEQGWQSFYARGSTGGKSDFCSRCAPTAQRRKPQRNRRER